MAQEPDFVLYTYYRSSCSGRLRIALNLKGINAKHVHVKLRENQHREAEYMKLNPSASVPVLTHLSATIDSSNGQPYPIGQSVAALEYLEEVLPNQVPLLPPASKPLERAKVRVLVNIIACDVQPVTNRRAAKAMIDLGHDPDEWDRRWILRGLKAYDDTAAETAGRFSVGDSPTLADVCLVPAVWNAEKNGGVDLAQFPTVSRVYAALSELEPVKKAHWSVQPDVPADGAWL